MAFAKPTSYEHLTGRGPVLNLQQPLLRRNSTTAVRRVDDWSGAGIGLSAFGHMERLAEVELESAICVGLAHIIRRHQP